MSNERVHNNMNEEKRTNVCALTGILLTALNIVVNVILLIIGKTSIAVISAGVVALVSLVLCICGASKAKESGKGKGISVLGIVLNVLVLLAVAVFVFFIFLFMQACAGIFQGLNPN